MLLTEILNTAVPWKWTFFDREHAEAVFRVGDVPYTTLFNGSGINEWQVVVANDKNRKRGWRAAKTDTPGSSETYGVTGSGNASVVLATAKQIMAAVKQRMPGAVLTVTAHEPSRQRLYTSLVNKHAPNAKVTKCDGGTEFKLGVFNTDPRSTGAIRQGRRRAS